MSGKRQLTLTDASSRNSTKGDRQSCPANQQQHTDIISPQKRSLSESHDDQSMGLNNISKMRRSEDQRVNTSHDITDQWYATELGPPGTSFSALIRQAKGEQQDPIVQKWDKFKGHRPTQKQENQGMNIKQARRSEVDDETAKHDLTEADTSIDELVKEPESSISMLRGKFAIWDEQLRGDPNFKSQPFKDEDPTYLGIGSFTTSMIEQCDMITEERRQKAELEEQRLFELITNTEHKIMHTCPICGETLSENIKKQFKSLRTSIRSSYAICSAHTRESVAAAAQHENYPVEINDLDIIRRSEKHMTFLAEVIREEQASSYRENAKKNASNTLGNRQNVLLQIANSDRDTLPGYYGLKGQGIMIRSILEHLEDTIKKASRTEKWITKISVTGYATSVLVPELAILLIMEDRNLSKSQAQIVMKDSIEYGRLMFTQDAEDDDNNKQTDACWTKSGVDANRSRRRGDPGLKKKKNKKQPKKQFFSSTCDVATDDDLSSEQQLLDLSSEPDSFPSSPSLTSPSSSAAAIRMTTTTATIEASLSPDMEQELLNFEKIKKAFKGI